MIGFAASLAALLAASAMAACAARRAAAICALTAFLWALFDAFGFDGSFVLEFFARGGAPEPGSMRNSDPSMERIGVAGGVRRGLQGRPVAELSDHRLGGGGDHRHLQEDRLERIHRRNRHPLASRPRTSGSSPKPPAPATTAPATASMSAVSRSAPPGPSAPTRAATIWASSSTIRASPPRSSPTSSTTKRARATA